MRKQIIMLRAMKGMFFCLMMILLATLGGCTVAEEGADSVGQKLQEGFEGRGKIVPNNPTKDSFGPEYR